MIAKSNLSLLNSLNLLNLSSKKRRILLLTFLIITFLLSSTIVNAPGRKESEIQNKFKPNSDQSLDQSMQLPGVIEVLNKGKEGYLNGQERGLGFQPPPDKVEFVGMWPYGGCLASAVDTTRNIALIGNGTTLQVLDISTPSSLSRIGEVTLNGHALDIAISGNYAYVVTNSYLEIVNISDLNNPYKEVVSFYFPMAILKSVAFSSGYVFVAAPHFGGLFIFNVSNPSNPFYQGFYPGPISYVAIWENYAICNYSYRRLDTDSQEWIEEKQVRVIDVSNPSNPSTAGTCKAETGYGLRGIDVSDDGYVYTCQYSDTDKIGKIAVIDARTPTNPQEVGSYVASGRKFEGIKVSGNYAYFYEPWGSLITIDISTPSSPFYVGEYDVPLGHDDLDISGSFAGISRDDGFSLFDVSDPGNPSQLGYLYTPGGVGHGNCIEVSGDYVYMSCSHGLSVMHVSDPSNPTVAGIFGDFPGGGSLAVSGRFAYFLSSPYIFIVDISSPRYPFLLERFDFPSDTDVSSIAVRGNYAYVSGSGSVSGEGEGWFLAVLDISNPSDPSIMGTYDCPGISSSIRGLALSGNYAYLAVIEYPYNFDDRKGSLRILDITDPTDPTEAGSYISPVEESHFSDVVVRGDYAYLAGDRLRIIDISNPESPKEISIYDYDDYDLSSDNVALSGDYAYLACPCGGLKVIDISDPYHPDYVGYYYVGYYRGGGEGGGIAASGNYAYLPGSLCILRNLLAPEVSITTPSALSTLHDSVSVEVLASHSSGINRVEFYIDDSYKAADNTSPYTYTWDTTSVAEGSHKIRARAYNNNGKSSDSEIEVTVRNHWNLTISSSSGGTTDPDTGTYSYDHGAEISITAIPDSGHEFSGWTGDVPDGHENENPLTIAMDSDKSITANFAKKGLCFIATAAYGSPLHPHVDVLRNLRDEYLMPNKLGRAFVNLYYKYSPFVANIIAKRKVLKVPVRVILLPFVAFSYSMLHLGPIITAIMLVLIFASPVFIISFFRRKQPRHSINC